MDDNNLTSIWKRNNGSFVSQKFGSINIDINQRIISRKRLAIEELTEEDRTSLVIENDALWKEVESVKEKVETYKKAIQKKKQQLQDLYEQLNNSQGEIRISKEEIRKAQNLFESLKNEIAEGLHRIIRKIESFPDVFSRTSQWKNYTDEEYLRQIKKWGGSSLLSFFTDIMDRTTALLRGNKRKINPKERNKSMVLIFNEVFKDAMPAGSFQYVPAWSAALLLKTITHSSLTIICLGNFILVHLPLMSPYVMHSIKRMLSYLSPQKIQEITNKI